MSYACHSVRILHTGGVAPYHGRPTALGVTQWRDEYEFLVELVGVQESFNAQRVDHDYSVLDAICSPMLKNPDTINRCAHVQ